ncbi:MAG: hypothetical protein V4474_00185 [Patescibacteria group bacterium]
MQTFWDNVLRVVAVIGLIAVLLLGAWGIIQLAFMLPGFFHNLGGTVAGKPTTTQESLTSSVPAAVVAGQPFNITWRHMGGTGEFAYSVSYSCGTGLSLAAPTPAGSYQVVQCNTPFNYTNASSSMPLVAILADGTKSAQVTITVAAVSLSTKQTTVSGTSTTNVTAPAVATKPTTTTATKTTTTKPKSNTGSTYYPSGRTTALSGYPDLAVSILSAQSSGGNTVVVFAVSNVGTNVSPTNWTLNAVLPSGYSYPAGPQQALYPGDRIVYTLRYSEDTSGTTNNPCNGYSFPCTPPITYGGPTSCNQYGPCAVAGYSNYNVVTNPYTYSTSYNAGYSAYGNTRTITINVDPFSQVYEVSKYNNTAQQTYVAY